MISVPVSLFLAYAVAVKVYKKTAPNGKITVYLGSRDFGDHGDYVDTIDGVVVVDEEYLKGRRVFGQIVTTFRYGREEDEIMGLHFSRQLYLALEQVYPPAPNKQQTINETSNSEQKPLNKLQDKLLRKLGSTAHPFTFQLPKNAPPSVTLQPGPEDQGSPLGVEYEVKMFVADNELEKPQRRNSVAMAIRKLQYTLPSPSARQPSSIVSKGFMLSPGKLNLEVTLDRELYFHGDKISAHVTVSNYSKKNVRSVKVSIVQHTEVTLVNGHYSKTVASLESKEGCPITPGASFSKVYQLLPLAAANKDRRGIALDGMLKEADTNLASSTLTPTSDAIGIVISYVARVRLYLGAIGGDLTADVPFKLCTLDPGHVKTVADSGEENKNKESGQPTEPVGGNTTSTTNATTGGRRLKKQMTREMSTDLIFEDFARRRQESEDLE